MQPRNNFGRVGFTLALVAIAGLFLGSLNEAGYILAYLGLPAVIFSLLGLIAPPRRWAWWGLGLGFLVCLYLPTLTMFAIKA